tara:strand:- start:221 stop:1660 length:1440 start_codon:yes stop_codon:yes gene_type:complete
MKGNNIKPVILCGGTGTRLWPLSRESFPKQYLKLTQDDKYTLLQNTFKRISNLKSLDSPIFITNEEHRFIIAEQIRQIGLEEKSIILEPIGRNTAAAIAIAAIESIKDDSDPNLLVLSSDHYIEDNINFEKAINSALNDSEKGKLVTFGVLPRSAETGYGYVEFEKKKNIDSFQTLDVLNFYEKPNKIKAEKFIKEGNFLWNSGIFMFKASTIIEELNKYAPDIISNCKKSLENGLLDLEFKRLNKEYFMNCPNISIDVAVMEKTSLASVVPIDIGWNDVGSWTAMWEISKKDNNGNVKVGKIKAIDCKNNYLRSENRLVVGIGLKNIVVVETNDAVLVASQDNIQKVKDVVNQLKKEGNSEGIKHRKIFRPWGNYISVVEGYRWQVKRIEVKPGAALSLQMHHHRTEHWIVVTGTAQVEIDSKNTLIGENKSIYIPLGSKHRLKNPGKISLVLIEVQSGAYLKEDDIVRIEDNYGRVN